MPHDHAVVSAELLTSDAALACPRLPSDLGLARSPRLLNWLVALTERAQRHLARVAEADAHATGAALETHDRFVNDAAGGGSRCTEAARSLRMGAGSR